MYVYVKRDYQKMDPMDVYQLVAKGTLKKFPNGYLDKKKIKYILRHIVFNVYGYTTKEAIISYVNIKFLRGNYMGGFIKFFEGTPYLLIKYSFDEWDIRAWEYSKSVPNNFWQNENNRREFIFWLAEKEGTNINDKASIRKISAQVIMKYGGSKVIKYAKGTYNLLDMLNPGAYKEWEITKVTNWTREKAIIATRWLIEEKLKITFDQACNLRVRDFVENNLDGLLQKVYDHSIMRALDDAYPNTFVRKSVRSIGLLVQN